jgi:hypothetical protein
LLEGNWTLDVRLPAINHRVLGKEVAISTANKAVTVLFDSFKLPNLFKTGESLTCLIYLEIDPMILNLTQHAATQDQLEAGVVDLVGFYKDKLVKALTFTTLPSAAEIQAAAEQIASLARFFANQEHLHGHPPSSCATAMIGGAPFLMGMLEEALHSQGFAPVYAFSVRESVENTDANGVVTKTAMFKHCGFVTV